MVVCACAFTQRTRTRLGMTQQMEFVVWLDVPINASKYGERELEDLGQAEKADGSVGLVRSPSCYSTVG